MRRVRCTVEFIELVKVCLNVTYVVSRGREVRCSRGYLKQGDAVNVAWRSSLCRRKVQGAHEGFRLNGEHNNNSNNNVYYIVADPGGRVV